MLLFLNSHGIHVPQKRNLITIELQPVSKGAVEQVEQRNISEPIDHGVNLKPAVETIIKFRKIPG
jgi:hypothetical protein